MQPLTRFLALHSGFRASDVEQLSVGCFLFSVFRKIAKGFSNNRVLFFAVDGALVRSA